MKHHVPSSVLPELHCAQLNGSIPKEMGSMRSLLELRVRENKLAGKIPPLLGNMRSLQTLDLTCNVLQGHIPDSMGDMTDLRELWPRRATSAHDLFCDDHIVRRVQSRLENRSKCSARTMGIPVLLP